MTTFQKLPELCAGDVLTRAEFEPRPGTWQVLVAYRASHTGRHTRVVHARSGQGAGLLRALAP